MKETSSIHDVGFQSKETTLKTLEKRAITITIQCKLDGFPLTHFKDQTRGCRLQWKTIYRQRELSFGKTLGLELGEENLQ